MARGYGWRCDNCDMTVIEGSDVGPVFSHQPPQHWYMVVRNVGVRTEPGVEPDQEWHLCRPRCLSEWARRQASP